MAEAEGTPAGSPPAASEGAPGGDAAVGTVGSSSGASSSALTGNAPGGGVDVVAGAGAPAEAAAVAAAKFRFLNRDFSDPKHAETVLGSEITRARKTQSELAQAQKQLEAVNSELAALRAMVAKGSVQGPGQGVSSEGQEAQPQSRSFARELADGGELDVIAKIFADPEMGPAHAMYRMAELLDERNSKSIEQVREEIHSELRQQQTRAEQERAVAKTFGVVRNLAKDYPEIADDNESEEAAAAQEEILKIITDTFSPEQLAQNPERVLRMAVEEYRRTYGTPVFAQAPGTSGSPSMKAAQAAEQAAQGQAAVPLDGTGVPRQRPNGQPETPLDRIRRENREFNKRIATTPSGRPLGFEA